MKKRIFLLCAALSAALLTAVTIPGASAETSTKREVLPTALTGVSASSGFQVTLTQGPASKVTVSIDSRLEPYLICTIEGSTLKLGFNNLPQELQNRKDWNQQATAQVIVSQLEVLKVSSGATIEAQGNFTAPQTCSIKASSAGRIKNATITATEFYIDASSAGDIQGVTLVNAQKTTVDCSSAATITLRGTTGELTAGASSAGSVNLLELRAGTVACEASSGASLSCASVGSIHASASSGASIRYKILGNGYDRTSAPTHTNASSGGSVSRID